MIQSRAAPRLALRCCNLERKQRPAITSDAPLETAGHHASHGHCKLLILGSMGFDEVAAPLKGHVMLVNVLLSRLASWMVDGNPVIEALIPELNIGNTLMLAKLKYNMRPYILSLHWPYN